jgi:hypothetical protein
VERKQQYFSHIPKNERDRVNRGRKTESYSEHIPNDAGICPLEEGERWGGGERAHPLPQI